MGQHYLMMDIGGKRFRVEFDIVPAGDIPCVDYDWCENTTLHDPKTGERLIECEEAIDDDEWHEIGGAIDFHMTPALEDESS